MVDKKKVLFVINTLGRAGAETAMITLMRRLLSGEYEGMYDISLLVITAQGEMIDSIPKGVRVLGKGHHKAAVLDAAGRKILRKTCTKALLKDAWMFRHFPYIAGNTLSMMTKGCVKPDKLMWRALSDAVDVKNEHYDLAVAFLEGGSTYFVADHVNADKKAAFIHVDYIQAGYNRQLDLDCYDQMDRIFAVSDEVKETFLKMYPEYRNKTEVFHNLIDRDRIISMSKAGSGFKDGFKGKRIVTVSRLTDQKALNVSIEAMKLIMYRLKTMPDHEPVRWYVFGEGNRRAFLKECIRKNGLEDCFLLCGSTDNPYPYMAQSDIYVHATGYEGKSIAIQEAKILGKAVIASDCSGNREQIENGTDGMLVPFDAVSVSEAVLRLIYDVDLIGRYGEKAASEMTDDNNIDKLICLMR